MHSNSPHVERSGGGYHTASFWYSCFLIISWLKSPFRLVNEFIYTKCLKFHSSFSALKCKHNYSMYINISLYLFQSRDTDIHLIMYLTQKIFSTLLNLKILMHMLDHFVSQEVHCKILRYMKSKGWISSAVWIGPKSVS